MEESFFATIRTYGDLSQAAESAWASLLRPKQYRKDEIFIRAGDVPTAYAFVVEGLFYQHYVGPGGDMIVKYFFPENRIAASVSATLSPIAVATERATWATSRACVSRVRW